MSRYFCHEFPEVLTLETRIVDARPGGVVLEQTPFHPGGGGQLADRGVLRWNGGEATVTGFEVVDGRLWHVLGSPVEPAGAVQLAVETAFRTMMTGAQLNDDGTARMDFDLPDADNDRLRALEPGLNDLIRQDLPIRYVYVPLAEAMAEHGLIRSRSVAPPPDEQGTIRIVEIVGLDRQACGGTHLASTARSRPVKILKIDNKGRHNRRVKIGLEG